MTLQDIPKTNDDYKLPCGCFMKTTDGIVDQLTCAEHTELIQNQIIKTNETDEVLVKEIIAEYGNPARIEGFKRVEFQDILRSVLSRARADQDRITREEMIRNYENTGICL